jgi:hypothetical protein
LITILFCCPWYDARVEHRGAGSQIVNFACAFDEQHDAGRGWSYGSPSIRIWRRKTSRVEKQTRKFQWRSGKAPVGDFFVRHAENLRV